MAYDGTFLHKFIFPVVTPPFIFGGMFLVARHDGVLWSLIFLPLVFLFLWVFFKITLPLKRIRIAGESIEISDYRRCVIVPLRQVRSVEDVWMGSPRARRIVFAEPTVFGESVVYLLPFHGFIQRDWPELRDVSSS
jgi:hypothetical protein